MKKLRMIVTSVIVLAIVGSAFAFNAKKLGAFCIDQAPLTGTCDAVLQGKKIDPDGTTFRYLTTWDGSAAGCTGNTNCTTSIKLIDNP